MRFGAAAEKPLGVVVVHYGAPGPTRKCVESVLADPSPVARQVVVVDNRGNLGPVPEARVLPCPENPGYGEGANRGAHWLAQQGCGDLVILNHDVQLLPGFLAGVVESLQRPQVGLVGGPLYLGDGRRLWSAGGAVLWPLGLVIQYRSYGKAWKSRPVGFLPGAAMGVRAEAFFSVGGFDPRFFMYHEDLDLCLRLRRAGWKLWYSPQVGAIHYLGSATGSHAYSSLYLEHLTRTRLRPFRPLVFRLWLAFAHSLFVLGRGAFFSWQGKKEEAKALLRGHWQALLTLGEGPRSSPKSGAEKASS